MYNEHNQLFYYNLPALLIWQNMKPEAKVNNLIRPLNIC